MFTRVYQNSSESHYPAVSKKSSALAHAFILNFVRVDRFKLSIVKKVDKDSVTSLGSVVWNLF